MNDCLKLENQLCFPLYSLSKLITSRYRPYLEPLDLTYPQYLVMLVLWEHGQMSVGAIGEKLGLDSGTLTPLLKRLEIKDLITRTRSKSDERTVMITLTTAGKELENQALTIPRQLAQEFAPLSDDELMTLKNLTNKLLNNQ